MELPKGNLITPVETFFGGSLIGLAAYYMLRCNGKITGISGLINSVVTLQNEPWKLLWLLGLIGSSALFKYYLPSYAFEPRKEENLLICYGIVGLLTGVGTILGSGCTSGHMICGVSRFSPRSIVASGVFFAFAVLTSNLFKRGNANIPIWHIPQNNIIFTYCGIFFASWAIYKLIKELHRSKIISDSTAENVTASYSGLVFGSGLGFSGMTKASKLLGFFDFFGNWDPSLIAIILSALLSNTIAYNFEINKLTEKKEKPHFVSDWSIPTITKIDKSLIIGAALFGCGWGYYGMCPGPILFNLIKFDSPIIVTTASMAVGMVIGNKIKYLS